MPALPHKTARVNYIDLLYAPLHPVGNVLRRMFRKGYTSYSKTWVGCKQLTHEDRQLIKTRVN